VCKKLINNSQPFGKKIQKTVGGIFLTHTVDKSTEKTLNTLYELCRLSVLLFEKFLVFSITFLVFNDFQFSFQFLRAGYQQFSVNMKNTACVCEAHAADR